MLTGFLRNNTGKPVEVKLIGADDSVLEFQDPEGGSVVLNNETAIANLGAKVTPLVPVTDLTAKIVID